MNVKESAGTAHVYALDHDWFLIEKLDPNSYWARHRGAYLSLSVMNKKHQEKMTYLTYFQAKELASDLLGLCEELEKVND